MSSARWSNDKWYSNREQELNVAVVNANFIVSVIVGAIVLFVGASAHAQSPAPHRPLDRAEIATLRRQLGASADDSARIALIDQLQTTQRQIDPSAVVPIARTVVETCTRLRAAQILCAIARTRTPSTATELRGVLAPEVRTRFSQFARDRNGCGPVRDETGLNLLAGGGSSVLASVGGTTSHSCVCDDECELRSTCCGRHSAHHRSDPQERMMGCACAYEPDLGRVDQAVCRAGTCQLNSGEGVGGGGDSISIHARVSVAQTAFDHAAIDENAFAPVRNAIVARVRTAFQAALQLDPSLRGQIAVVIQIGVNGAPTDVEIEGDEIRNPTFAARVRATLRSIRVPVSNGPTTLRMTFACVAD